MSPRSRSTWLLAAPVLAVLAWVVVFPNLTVISGSLANGFAYWREFAASPGDMEALRTTLVISVATVLFATIIGVPLAFLLTRVEFPGRRVLGAVATIPAALPPLVGVIAFLFLYGESGVVTRVVQRVLGLAEAPWTFTGIWPILVVHTYAMYVYVYLFVAAGLERYDTSLDEAASGLGAGRSLRLRRITLPLLTPSLAGAMLLVFMSALGSFSAPYVFGGGLRVMSTQILASKLNGAMGLAYVETTVLAITAVAALVLLRWFERRRSYAMTGKGRVTRTAIPLRGGRTLAFVGASLLVFILDPAARDAHAHRLREGRRVDHAAAAAVVHHGELHAPRRRTGPLGADQELRAHGHDRHRCERDLLLRGGVSRSCSANSADGAWWNCSPRSPGRSPPRRSRSASPPPSTATIR